jgi:hypothetical protein
LDFGALGSIVIKPLFPDAPPEDPRHGLRLHVRFVGAGQARAWAFALEGARQRDARRLAELRRGLTPDEAPGLWGIRVDEQGAPRRGEDGALLPRLDVLTPEGLAEQETAKRRTITEAVVRLEGLSVGGKDSGDLAEPAQIAALLEGCGLLDLAALAVVEAQSPRLDQLFSAASSR